MARVESFELDHNTVKAPYVRLAGTEQNGDALVEKYDLRFLQPNKDALPTGALHTLEHLLAVNMRDELKGIIDISPMGCRTGFYMIMPRNGLAGEYVRCLIHPFLLPHLS